MILPFAVPNSFLYAFNPTCFSNLIMCTHELLRYLFNTSCVPSVEPLSMTIISALSLLYSLASKSARHNSKNLCLFHVNMQRLISGLLMLNTFISKYPAANGQHTYNIKLYYRYTFHFF